MNNLSKYYLLLLVFIGLYVHATLALPVDPAVLEKFNLSVTQLRLLSLSVVIPYIAIWVFAFYGFIRFKEYTQLIRSTKDGKPLETLANGHMLLAFSLPLSALASTYLNYAARRWPEFAPDVTIFRNYLALALTFASFALIYRGSLNLAARLKKKPDLERQKVITIGFIILAITYTYFVFRNPIRQVVSQPTEHATFYLPDWLIVLTIIVPYLYVWYLGMRSAAYIDLYKENVRGQIYKPYFQSLVSGITWVLIASILLQFLAALSDTVQKLGLQQLLLLVYVLLVVISIGYIKIAIGAKRLKKIEEV